MHIILDFDGTITVDDTIDHLAALAVAFQEEQQTTPPCAPPCSWGDRWAAIVDRYLADHRAHRAGYSPVEHARTELDDELAFLRSLRSVDGRSIGRLQDAGLFAGMPPERLFEGGRQAVVDAAKAAATDKNHVRIRPGFAAFLQEAAARRHWPVSIVSVNWSDAWIRGVLKGAREGDETRIRVFANKVTLSGAIVPNFRRGAEDEHAPFASCSDKVEALEAAVAEAVRTQEAADEAVVYVGDSTTDLECLVHAGRTSACGGGGIAMANGDGPATSKLIQTLERLGYSVPHVSDARSFQRSRTAEEGDAPRLAWARDYNEILASAVLDSAGSLA